MIRKLFAVISALMLLLTCAASLAEEEVAFDTEELDVDITDLVHIAEEETAKDQKDSDGAYIMTVTATGDFTIGGDNYHHKDLFTKELNNHGGDINFVMKNTKDIFLADDLTILNFEGTLTDTKSVPGEKKNNDFLFNISPEYVSVLPDNGVEAVSLDNNHVWDHGEEGLSDTKTALDGAGVIYSTPLEAGIFNYKDQIQVCMLSYNCIDRYGTGFKKDRFKKEYTEEFLQYDTFEDAVCAQISKAKELYPLVIVSFHWGKEPTKSNPGQGYIPTQNQINLGHLAVEAGADLIIGNHSHRIQPIENYLGKFICYSLGNFCFAGNSKPSDMSSIIFQIRYRVKDGSVSYKDFRVIPIRISSNNKQNDFIPTVLDVSTTDGAAVDAILNVLTSKENAKDLSDPVTDFPLKFQ